MTLAVAIASYAASLALFPRLPDGRRITPVGALAPAVIALGPHGFAVASYPAILALLVAAELVLRRQPITAAKHAVLLTASALMFIAIPMTLAAVTASGVLIAVGEANPRRPLVHLRSTVHIAFLSTAALVVLSYESLGPVAFVVLLGPLYATYRGFARYGEARDTYAQTVHALGRLAERAGYANEAHHERVAALCERVANALGLHGEPVRMLKLTALFHDVGAVSVRDPEDLPLVYRAEIARASADVFKETGYLAAQAPVVLMSARPAAEDCPLESRILRVCSTYDDLAAQHGPDVALKTLEARAKAGDRPVYEALRRTADATSHAMPASTSTSPTEIT